MTFEEAEIKLHEIAGDKHCTLRYSRTRFSDKARGQECSVYMDGCGMHVAKTWETALALLIEEKSQLVQIEIVQELEEKTL